MRHLRRPGRWGGGSLPPPTHADRAIYTEINPSDHTEEFDFANGVVAILDDTLDKVFISNQLGTFSFPLSEMFLQTANGNAQTAASLRAQLHQRLTDPISAMQFGEGGSNLSSVPFGNSPMVKQGPGGGGSSTCSGFWGCIWTWIDWAGRQDLYWNYGRPDSGPSDPARWDDWNQTQCHEEHVTMTTFVPEALGTGVACGALGADAGTSTGLCLAGLGSVAGTNYWMGRSIVNCHSVYTPH